MKITKELLEHLKVNTISLKQNDKNVLCFLERIEKNLWTFIIPQKLELSKNQKIQFQLSFEHDSKQGNLNAVIADCGVDWIDVIPDMENTNTRVDVFLQVISAIEQKYESFGRRKEERIKIGKEKSKDFGLISVEQCIFLKGIKVIQPCVVLDASVHGICIITPDTPQIKNEENFCVKLEFEKPTRTVILKAHRVYARLNKTERKTFITLSCQLLEPIHFEWRDRVIKMIEENKSC